MVDENGVVAINSPETLKAIEYAMELYKTFIPGTEGWLDVNNNRAFLAGELSVIANGISAYYSAKNDPKLAEIAADIRTTNLPIGPVGKSVELFQVTSAVIFAYTKYPERGEGLSPVHVRGCADERLDHEFQRLLLPDLEGLRQQSDLDGRSGERALCQGVGNTSAQWLCRTAWLCIGRRHGRLCPGRHVRRSGHGRADAAGRHGARREACQSLLQGLTSVGGPAARIAGLSVSAEDRTVMRDVTSPALRHDNPSLLRSLQNSRGALGFLFMLPAAILLLLFLTYPLGLGVWLGFTDERIGRSGVFIGLENYAYLWDDSVFWLAVFNTLLYTSVASVLKFGLGLWLALILNEKLPFKAFFRAIVLLPWVVPTVLSAIAFWWIFDAQFSIISWALERIGLIDTPINFLGDPTNARASVIAANVWRGIPFVAITLLAGLQTISPSLYEAATLDGATPWQRFRFVTFPLLTPIIAIVMTFSVLFTFTDFQLIYVLTRGGPVNATHLMATLSFQRGISGGNLGEGAAIAVAMIPFLLAAILFSYFGLQRRRWQQGGSD